MGFFMRPESRSNLVVVFGALAMLAGGVAFTGCGGDEKASCAVGSASCPCTSGGACNPGLSCSASNVCVGPAVVGPTVGLDGGATNDSGILPAVTPPNAEAICANQSALCTKLNECAPLVLKGIYGTLEVCKDRQKISCVDAINAPASGLTSTTVNACLAALPAATCEDLIYRKVSACDIKGTRPNGGACGTDAQCLSGHCTQNNAACGVCAAHVNAGASCVEADDCEPGLDCSAERCVVPGAAGTICSDTQVCKYGLYCLNGSCVNTNTTAGANCADSPFSCNILKGIYCNLAVGKCATLGFVGPGEPCGLVASKFVFCSAGDCIYPSVDADEGICGSYAGDGATCGDTTGCMEPAICIAGRCKLPSSSACL